MSDLNAAIRAKLDGLSQLDDDCNSQCGVSCAAQGYDDMKAALLAVLDQHPLREFPDYLDGGPSSWICDKCHDSDPCCTRYVIADALGIEVDGG